MTEREREVLLFDLIQGEIMIEKASALPCARFLSEG